MSSSLKSRIFEEAYCPNNLGGAYDAPRALGAAVGPMRRYGNTLSAHHRVAAQRHLIIHP